MNGIDFILRDRAGCTQSVPEPRRRLCWATPKRKAMRPEEVEFIKGAKGRLTARLLRRFCADNQRHSERSLP